MKAFICNNCRKTVDPTPQDMTPPGWYTLYGGGGPDRWTNLHACGPLCLQQLVATIAADAATALGRAEVPRG